MGRLFERICTIDTLRQAWKEVQRKKARGGIDGVSVAEFAKDAEEHLGDLSQSIRNGRYSPEPADRIHTPKFNQAGEYRPLSLPTVKDKIAQQAVRMVIEPFFERRFLDSSYAYRANKGPRKAIGRVTHYITHEKKTWAIFGDLDNFFDSISHDRLLDEVKKVIYEPEILSLIRMWIKIGAMDQRGRYHDMDLGIAQGGIVSPLLSNIYAHPLDEHLASHKMAYVRYADNFIALCTSREEAAASLEIIRNFIEQTLRLRLNPEKEPVRDLQQGFVFLGVLFRGQERFLAREKKDKIRRKLDWLTNKNRPHSLEKILDDLAEAIEGVCHYYGFLEPWQDFKELDEYLLRRLRVLLTTRRERKKLKTKSELSSMLRRFSFFAAREDKEAEGLRRRIVEEAFGGVASGGGSGGVRKSPPAEPAPTPKIPVFDRDLPWNDNAERAGGEASAPREPLPSTLAPRMDTPPHYGRDAGLGVPAGPSTPAPPMDAPTSSTAPETSPSDPVPSPSTPSAASGSPPAAALPPTAEMPSSVGHVPGVAPRPAATSDGPPVAGAAAPSAESSASSPLVVGDAKTAASSTQQEQKEALAADRKVASKKQRYVKRGFVESEIVVHTPGTFIGHRGNRVVMTRERKKVLERPMNKVKSILIRSRSVTVSSDLVEACAHAEIPIVFSSPNGRSYASVHAPLQSRPELGLLQLQALQDGSALTWAKSFVMGKLRNQLNLLKFYLRHREDEDPDYARKMDEVEVSLEEIWKKVRALEMELPYETVRNRLFGFEGQAAICYWDMVRLLLPEDIDFPGRVTRGAKDLVNASLNFGYSLLYPRIERALLMAGLNLYTSLFHAAQPGKPTLTFDFIEPFRAPVVDRAVFSLLTRGRDLAVTSQGRLSSESVKMVIEAVVGRLGTLVPYKGDKIMLEQVIHKQARLLARSLRNEKKFKPFISRY